MVGLEVSRGFIRLLSGLSSFIQNRFRGTTSGDRRLHSILRAWSGDKSDILYVVLYEAFQYGFVVRMMLGFQSEVDYLSIFY